MNDDGAETGLLLHEREARVRKEQAAIHRLYDHCVVAGLCIKVSNAQEMQFAKRVELATVH